MKLYRFRYSPYARKVQMLLDLLGQPYELVEVDYLEREELASVTGGYVMVPVLVDESGAVTLDSRAICERLLPCAGTALVPLALEAAVWAYADFSDGPLEDILFRVASPYIRDSWDTAFARGLYQFIKERKFGVGCVDTWRSERESLIARGRKLLAPTLNTLARQPFLFGDLPTLADAALYGNCVMLEEAQRELLGELSPVLVSFVRRLELFTKRT